MKRTKKPGEKKEFTDDVPMKKLPEKELTKIEDPVKEPKLAGRSKLRYQVKSGTLKIVGKTYKGGEVFDAYPEQIPIGFRKDIICISPIELQQQETDKKIGLPAKEIVYMVVPARAEGWFNVVNTITKKAINENTLRLANAEKLRDSLNT